MNNTSTSTPPGVSSASSPGGSATPKYPVGTFLALKSGGPSYEVIKTRFNVIEWHYELQGMSGYYREVELDNYWVVVASPSSSPGSFIGTLAGASRTATGTKAILDDYWDALPQIWGYNSTRYKCECGADSTFGHNCGPEFHSSWCPKGKEAS